MRSPNSYRDVAHIHQIQETTGPAIVESSGSNRKVVIGIKNVTEGAGATTLTYLMYKELTERRGINTLAIEVNKRDFMYFGDNNLVSTTKNELANILLKNQHYDVVLVDLNDCEGDICGDVLYLVEPSIIKMSKINKKDRMAFSRLRGQKIILNKCLLSKSDVKQFESESGGRLFYVMPPLDDRKRQQNISELLGKLGIILYRSKEED